jgi:hypothetical protein
MGHLEITPDGSGTLLQHVQKMPSAQIAHLTRNPVLPLLQIGGGFFDAQEFWIGQHGGQQSGFLAIQS